MYTKIFLIFAILVVIADRYRAKCDEPHEVIDITNPDTDAKSCSRSTSSAYTCEMPVRTVPSGQPLNIILLGKTGHGKSATANSIFGEERFKSLMSSNSATSKCQKECGIIERREICLVDTPGTMDTRDPLKALNELGLAIALAPEGVDAFLIVISFNTRMTKEEEMAIGMLQKLFGPDVLVKYGVMVFTYGDLFRTNIKKSKHVETFQEHIESQTGYMKSILENCSYRYALIDNTQEDPNTLRDNVIQIITLIDKLVAINKGIKYTNDLFQMAQQELEKEQKRLDEERSSLEKDRLEIEAFKTQAKDYEEKMRELENRLKKLEEDQKRKEEKAGERVAKEAKNRVPCFPPNALVTLYDGRTITIADLRIGDIVLSTAVSGKLEYSEVYFFAHSNPNATSDYINLSSPNSKLKLTPEHHIFIARNGQVNTIAAKDVIIGDSMLVLNENISDLVDEPVMEISKSIEVGVYAPITMSGTIVVNNVLASCYVDIVPPKYAHPMLWPLRQIYRLSPSLTSRINAEGNDGMPLWVQFIMDNLIP